MVHIIWMITWSFAPLTSPMIKSAIAKFMMYKLFIVRRRGFDKNDRKMIIFPKTVKKLNYYLAWHNQSKSSISYAAYGEVICLKKRLWMEYTIVRTSGSEVSLHLYYPVSLMDFEAPRSCHRPNFIVEVIWKKIR